MTIHRAPLYTGPPPVTHPPVVIKAAEIERKEEIETRNRTPATMKDRLLNCNSESGHVEKPYTSPILNGRKEIVNE